MPHMFYDKDRFGRFGRKEGRKEGFVRKACMISGVLRVQDTHGGWEKQMYWASHNAYMEPTITTKACHRYPPLNKGWKLPNEGGHVVVFH